LTNLQQRMAELGGQCQIASAPGKGCRVELVMPLLSQRRHFWTSRWFKQLTAFWAQKKLPARPSPAQTPK